MKRVVFLTRTLATLIILITGCAVPPLQATQIAISISTPIPIPTDAATLLPTFTPTLVSPTATPTPLPIATFTPFPTATLTATATPTPTLTPTPIPLTFTPTLTATPTPIPATPTPVPFPAGTTFWKKFPIMPQATGGRDVRNGYGYFVKATVEQARDFYINEMPKLGWKHTGTTTLDKNNVIVWFDNSVMILIGASGDGIDVGIAPAP